MVFEATNRPPPGHLVDKPRRRKQSSLPWGKIAAVVVAALVVGLAGYYIYNTYIYRPPPLYARVDTTDGSFDIELFPACAPQTVSNFVSLANSGFFNDLVWHRIVNTPTPFVIQTGDPNTRNGLNSTRGSWGQGGSNHTVPLEICGWLHNYQGYLGMARSSDPNSGTSQWYVNLSNSTSNLGLDGNYTVFGRVISGWSVVQSLAKSPICQPPTCPSTWPSNEPLPAVFVNDVVMLPTPPTSTTT